MIEPSIETPHRLFSSSSRYHAPVFQRLYVWGEDQLEGLFQDILSEDTTTPQFLGAIVLKDLGKKGPTSPTSYLIIDGQQRLTTIFMLFAAAAELALAEGENDLANYIRNEYLIESRSPSFVGQPKLVPTMQDRSSFWEFLEAGFPDTNWNFTPDPGDGKKSAKLESQYIRIQEKLWELVYDAKDRFIRTELETLLDHLQNRLQLIVITLEEHDDANLIFSKLNATGVPLGLADLVRNEVFSKFGATDGKKADKFYDSYWHPFERSFQKITDLNAFFPVYSYIAFGGSVTKAGAFPELQKRWKKNTPQKILSDLTLYAPLYQALISGRGLTRFGKELNGMINRFSRMPRATVTWPYILQVLHNTQTPKEEKAAVACLSIVEAFLVRRSLTGIEPTGLHAVFKSLWQHAGIDVGKVKAKIITRTISMPTDGELEKKLIEEPVDTRVILPYVLSELERDYRKQNRFDMVTNTVITIEHIMPKKRGAAWKVAVAKDYDTLVGLIGNLAPLSDTQNKSLKDDAWSEKRKRFAGSNFFVTQKTAKAIKWEETVIRHRTKEISGWIQKRWPSPDI